MKAPLHELARRVSANGSGSQLIGLMNEIQPLTKITTVLLMTALLLPLILIGSRQTTFAAAKDPAAPDASTASSAPAFVSGSSAPMFDTTFSAILAINGWAVSGYRAVADFLVTAPPPEGFAPAKMPTARDKISGSISSFIAPLSFIYPDAAASAAVAAPMTALGTTKFDFTGDGYADVSRWQTSGEWKIKSSANGSFSTDSSPGAGTAAAPADYDGDGITDRAVFTDYAGTWKVLSSSTGQTQTISPFGQYGDKVVSGNYNGNSNGKADLAVWRPSNGTWYVLQLSTGTVTSRQWGQAGDIPVPGNYDGDDKLDYVVYRPSNGTWYQLLSSSGYSYTSAQWGASSDIPVPADYDGDGKTDLAAYRPLNGTWYVSRSDGLPYISKIWGNYGDQPVPADYDGDGKADFAVWRPTTGIWYIANSKHAADPNVPEYSYHQLGIPGDTAVPSAYLKQIGGQVATDSLSNARLAPINATGDTDLYSRNFSWGTGLVGLPGRAGLDAGLGISYNSLVWTKEPNANVMVFDADHANVAPGFNFGFPRIEPSYYNGLTQKFSYLMVTPDGGRIEFRQSAASNIYDAVDSSYAQLKVNPPAGGGPQATEILTMTVTTTDGTQMDYDWKAGAYRLNRIKDRNGNIIDITYDVNYGLLLKVKDTLGREITVDYDAEFSPTAIKQQWNEGNGDGDAVTHTYATFTYTYPALNPNFAPTVGVYGPGGGSNVKLLNNIAYTDGSTTSFDYNAYGQVYKVTQKAADYHELSHVKTNLETVSGTPTDCPRLSVVENYVENFNNGAATITHIDYVESEIFNFDNISGTATKVDVYLDAANNPPHAPTSRTWYYPAGNWGAGLPFGTEDIADGNVRQRWTRTVWTQDDTNLVYKLNPRVLQSKVGDTTNVKRTDLTYLTMGSLAGYGLVSKIELFDGSTNILQKKTETDYNSAAAYLSRRIIGLPSEVRAYGLENGALNLASKVGYGYDENEGGFGDTTLQQNLSTVVQHDNTNYGTGFVTGRGNLTSVTRYNVTNSAAITSSFKHNTAGAVVTQTTPGSGLNPTRTVKISYTDSFNSTSGGNTYAYPTTLTDPAGYLSTNPENYSSFVKYRYDTGANVWAKSPAPQNQGQGKISERIFDTVGRLQKQMTDNYGAYVRYEYPSNGIQVKSYATVTDGLGEAASISWTDGAGRIRRAISTLPNSTGGWSGVQTEYDILGQAVRQTVPTEVSASETTGAMTPTGDDNRGNDAQGNPLWLWNSQEYDWKGRVTREINTDGTDRVIGYQGCGCAGGQITTIQGESVPNPGQPGANTRRTQRIYADIIGRAYKTETLNWDGSVYSTVKKTFNGRDQETLLRQYAGDTSATYQDTTAEYDGFGRTLTTHKPEQRDANGTATYTTYSYNADDSIQSVMDARGAIASYAYNDPRGLLTNVTYSGSNSSTTLPLTFGYDNIGNRISMQDGLGTVSYGYDQLSRLTSETRQFSDALTDPTVPATGFKMEYGYTLGGQLKSYKDPYDREFQFGLDKIGRNTSITGTTAYAGVTSYSSGYKYRAFGSVKEISYGNQTTATMTYNNRLQPGSYRLNYSAQTMFGKDYYYTTPGNNDNDGLLKKSVHYDGTMTAGEQSKRNQVNTYDALGRISTSAAGEAGSTPFGGNITNGPYQQSYSYDAFGNLTNKNDRDFGLNQVGCTGCPRNLNYSETIANNRTQNSTYFVNGTGQSITNYQYDNDGRLLNRDGDLATFDATGKIVFHDSPGTAPDDTYSYDGDGDLLKWVQTGSNPQFYYYVKSSVFGANMLELGSMGAMSKEFVFSSTGSKTAYLKDSEVVWIHEEPSGKERYEIKQDRTALSKATYDPTGAYGNYNNSYSNGQPCPPNSCYSPENSALLAQTNRGFDGLERLTQQRNAQWLQSHEFDILTTPVGWKVDGKYYPGRDRPKVRHEYPPTPVYGEFLQLSGDQSGPKLGKGVPENLKILVLGLANYEKCGDTFEKLIGISSKKYSKETGKSLVGVIYDSLKSVKIDSKIGSEGQNAGGHVSIQKDYNTDPRGILLTWDRFALTTLQEMLHQVYSTDSQLQKASRILYQSGNLDPLVKARVDENLQATKRNPKDIYEHTILSMACFIDFDKLQLDEGVLLGLPIFRGDY